MSDSERVMESGECWVILEAMAPDNVVYQAKGSWTYNPMVADTYGSKADAIDAAIAIRRTNPRRNAYAARLTFEVETVSPEEHLAHHASRERELAALFAPLVVGDLK